MHMQGTECSYVDFEATIVFVWYFCRIDGGLFFGDARNLDDFIFRAIF